MKNVIFILVDSIFSECMSYGRTEISSTPFIDSLIKEGFYAENVYSHGPYTDAATIGLYCANPALDNYGYYFGINTAPNNHYQLFKNAGYETIGLYYPYYLISSKTKKSLDYSVYISGFKYESVWGGKLKDYAKLKNERGLSNLDYKLIEKCLLLVFDCWFGFYEDLNDKWSSLIISTLKDEKLRGTGFDGLKKEYDKFKQNTKGFIDEILELGMEHPLAYVNEFDYGKDNDKKFLAEIYERHNSELKKITNVNTRKAILNSPFKLRKAFSHCRSFIKTHDKNELRYMVNYGMLLLSNQMMINRSLRERNWQEVASLNKQIETLTTILKNRGKANKPFYATIHALEPHHNISYFSFDSFNHDLIDEEFNYLMPLLDGLGKNFSGNLLVQLSLRYVDLCIKRLCNQLRDLGLYDNTLIALVSDHGTSYTFNPLRSTVVNTFHKENYNIPIMIWSNNMDKSKMVHTKDFYMSDDVLPTLMSIAGLDHSMLEGRDMTADDLGRPYVITEYMGPGVPDMINREAWMSIRNRNYVIAYKSYLSREFCIDKPYAFYDLRKDPEELNPTEMLYNSETHKMGVAIEFRFREIQRKTADFISNVNKKII